MRTDNSIKYVNAVCLIDDVLDRKTFKHSIQVANLLSSNKCKDEVIIAGVLHDVLEDTSITYEDLRKEFGKKIADLVHEVTHEGQKDNHGYYFPRLKSKDAIMIKYADRLNNLNRISKWDTERQKHYLKISKFWRTE